MTVKENKESIIVKMLLNGESLNKTKEAAHCAKSTIQQFRKILNALLTGRPLTKNHDSSRIERIKALIDEHRQSLSYTTPRHNPFSSANTPVNTPMDVARLLQEVKDSETKRKEQEETNSQLAEQRDTLETQLQQLTLQGEQKEKEKEQLTQGNIKLTTELDAVIEENKDLQETVKKQNDLINKLKEDHQRELIEHTHKANRELLAEQQEHIKELQELNDGVKIMTDELNKVSNKKIQEITIEKDQYKSQVKRLEMEHENDLFKFVIVAFGGVVGGAIISWWLWWKKTNSTLPVSINYGKNTEIPEILLAEPIITESDIHHTCSGETRRVTTPGTMYSGAVYHQNGSTSFDGSNTLPNSPAEMNHSPFYSITSGAELVTNTSCSQYSTTFVSSHLENNAFTSYVKTPVSIPSSFQIPFNYPFIPLRLPLPDDLSEIYPMKHLRNLNGIGFEIYIEKLIAHKGCPVERMPSSHDYGADLIATWCWVPTVVQCKQTSKVGVDTILKTIGAMKHYEKTKGTKHCLVITTGEFTKEAEKEARILGVEVMDGKRLLEEIYKAQFFYVPENESDYDPNK